MLEHAEEIGRAAERGARYIIAKEGSDGYLGEVAAFHKSVWALSNTGHFAEANRIVQWVKDYRIRPNGTVQHKLDLAGLSPMLISFVRKTPFYRDSCFVLGAQRLGRYDVSMRIYENLRKHQQRRYGGILDPDSKRGEGEMGPVNTAFFGYAALAVGRLDDAERAGRYFETVIDLQSDPENEYYTVLDSKKGLVKRFPREERQLYLFEPKVKGDVFYWMIGMPMGLFAQLYGATRKRKYLERAQWLYELHCKCPEQVWKIRRSGKSAWGLAYLATVTGDREYAKKSEQIMRNIAKTQLSDGSWDESIEGTAEMTMWSSEVLKLLT